MKLPRKEVLFLNFLLLITVALVAAIGVSLTYYYIVPPTAVEQAAGQEDVKTVEETAPKAAP